ncbi:TraA family conjugative transfer protein [Allochromatium humboldtianum]|uniref:TraA family conjugative transfer protein n=1 Tax=Allochromatium humboldtianum TaxID=504901 RepID=UPI001CA43BCF|nr:TraA family conjugative transfer protein [Allochromatium humboldtianum]
MKKTITLTVAALLSGASLQAMAGAGGTEFTQVHEQVSGWANGTLGKTMGVAALLVGLGIGVIKQSVMAAVVGVAMALVAGFGPDVIDGVITAGLPIVNTI